MLSGFRRILDMLFILLMAIALVTGAGSLLTGQPLLATVVRSESMVPTYTRGDIAVIWNWPGSCRTGDIVLFLPASGTLRGVFTLHRIVGTDENGLFLTKGDAAAISDQESGLCEPVLPEQILAKAVHLAGVPLKVPGLGLVALWVAEGNKVSSRMIAAAALVGVLAMAVREFSRSKKLKAPAKLDPTSLMLSLSMFLVLSLSALTLFQSRQVNLIYEVRQSPGIIAGHPIGVITPGQTTVTRIASIKNTGFIPMYVFATSDDPAITPNCEICVISPGMSQDIEVTVKGGAYGAYRSRLTVSLVFPILPSGIVRQIGGINHYLGALAGPMCVGIVIALLWTADPATRRRLGRLRRRFLRRL